MARYQELFEMGGPIIIEDSLPDDNNDNNAEKSVDLLDLTKRAFIVKVPKQVCNPKRRSIRHFINVKG